MANPIPLVQSASPSAIPGSIPVNISGIDTSDKPQIAALTVLAGGSDLAATVAKLNAVIAALKA